MKTVEDIMEKRFEVKRENTSVCAAVRMLAKKKERTILVVSKAEILGIVTTTDILYKVVAKGKNPTKVVLKDIMSRPVHAIGPGNSLKDAADMMQRNKVKKLPVINEKGEILGMISDADILAADPSYVNLVVNLEVPVEHKDVGE